MRLRCIPEKVPEPLPKEGCPSCGRRRIPYLPRCACGYLLEPATQVIEKPDFWHAPKEEEAKRFAHLSDLHLGMRTPDGLAVEVRLRGLLASFRDLEVDGLVISGDLTKFGGIDELRVARQMLDDFGYGAENRILIPGNHDIPRGADSSNFSEVFELEFPIIKEFFPGVFIAGFDSNKLLNRTLFERRWVPVRGRIGKTAQAALRQAWSPLPGSSRILVLHHHLARLSPESRWVALDAYTFRTDRRLMAPLLDADEFLALANELQITAVLHGHKHWFSRTGYRVGSIPVFNAGSITRMRWPQFRLLDFQKGKWTRLYRVEFTSQ